MFTITGWGAIRKWPLIRPSPTHTVCSQTKTTGSGIWFQRTIVWSEVTSVWGWYDQRSVRSGDGMIRGHFGLGMVWSEVTLVWGWYDQKSLQDGNGLIRGGFRRTLVWSETVSSGIFFLIFCFFLQRNIGSVKRQQKAAFWSQTDLEFDVFAQNQRGPTDWTCQSPYKEILFNCSIRCFIWKAV